MITTSQLAIILDEYMRRYACQPADFLPLLDEQGQPIPGYGRQAARHMAQIAKDLDMRALIWADD